MDVLFPPGPQKSLLFGDAPQFRQNPLDFMQRSARTYGDLVHFRFGPSHAYLLTNPRDAHRVLVEHHDQFADRPSLLRALNSAMGHDLFAPKDKITKKTLRRGKFRAKWIEPFVDEMARTTVPLLDMWQGGDPATLLREITLQMVTTTLFGEAEGERKNLALKLDRALAATRDEQRFRSPLTLPGWIPTTNNRTYRQAQGEMKSLLRQLIANHAGGMLAHLLDTAESPTLAAEELLALFYAGREAAAQTVAWAWALLAQHPEAADALHAEVDTVLGDRMPSADDLPNLTYCEMVFQETLRLHPPVWLISRQAKKETRLGEYYVPAGSTIFVSPYIIHHSQRYNTAPDRFIPERFGESFLKRGTGAYMPFGAGTYAEVEREYSTMIGKLVLALAAQRFRFAPASPISDEPTAYPRGVQLQPERRVNA
jgi:cytochrome P450